MKLLGKNKYFDGLLMAAAVALICYWQRLTVITAVIVAVVTIVEFSAHMRRSKVGASLLDMDQGEMKMLRGLLIFLLFLGAIILPATMLEIPMMVILGLAAGDLVFKKDKQASSTGEAQRTLIIDLAWIVIGFIYVIKIRSHDEHGRELAYLLVAATYCGDIGGNIVGSLLNKHPHVLAKVGIKRHPMTKISPGKSWEGFVGVLALAIAGAFATQQIIELPITHLQTLTIGLGCGAFGALGDLVESSAKRRFNEKEAGWLLGSHGGAFDRTDSLLLNAPLFFWYVFSVIGL